MNNMAQPACIYNRNQSIKTQLHDAFIDYASKSVIQQDIRQNIKFGIIKTNDEWLQLGKFRRDGYEARKPYMLLELDAEGKDQFDQYGAVYAAWINNEIAASIRLCAYPFESKNFINDEQLQELLGVHYRDHYLEWTRLLIAQNVRIPNLLNGLIIYAGMKTLATTRYQHYFGYSTPLVKKLFYKFKISNTVMDFTIPHRGDHRYVLFHGSFIEDLNSLLRRNPFQSEHN